MHYKYFSKFSILITLLVCGCALKNPDTEEGSVEPPVPPDTEGDALTGLPDVDGESLTVSTTDLAVEVEPEEADIKPSNLDDAFDSLREKPVILGFVEKSRGGVAGQPYPAPPALSPQSRAHRSGIGASGMGGGGGPGLPHRACAF